MTNPTRWRKKPVVIDAIRNEGEWAPVLAWLDSNGYTVPFLGRPAVTRNQDGSLSIETLEGTMRADVGDWVIRGVQGEFYPCKDGIFAATYEPAVEPLTSGRAAYEAYAAAMPHLDCAPWDEITDELRGAMDAAAHAGTMAYMPEDWTTMLLQRDEARAEIGDLRSLIAEILAQFGAEHGAVPGRMEAGDCYRARIGRGLMLAWRERAAITEDGDA